MSKTAVAAKIRKYYIADLFGFISKIKPDSKRICRLPM